MVAVSRDAQDNQPAAAFWRPMAAFYGLSLLITWIVWAPLYLSRTGLGWLPFTVPMPWTVAGTLGPPIAATLVRRFDRQGPTFRQLIVPTRTALPGAAVAMMVIAVTFVLGTSTILTKGPPHGWAFDAFGLYGFHVLLTLIGGPLFEEWGWRGFAQLRMQRRIGALPAALVIGPAWAVWHLPLFLIPTWSSASPLMYVLMLTGLSVVMAWGLNLASGWIVAAILMHDVFNGSSRVLGRFLAHADIRAWPDPVTAMALAFAASALLLSVFTWGRLGGRRPPA